MKNIHPKLRGMMVDMINNKKQTIEELYDWRDDCTLYDGFSVYSIIDDVLVQEFYGKIYDHFL